MKKTYSLYGLAILAVVGILTCFLGYAIDPPPATLYTQTDTSIANPKRAIKKDPCPCCDEKQKRMNKMMREWLNEEQQENSSNL